MGSEIRVKSVPNRGSCFSFEMSARIVGSERSVSPISGQAAGYSGPRKRVMVVDDTDANRAALTDTLGSLGFDVSEGVNDSHLTYTDAQSASGQSCSRCIAEVR
jgi:hypothetical protein